MEHKTIETTKEDLKKLYNDNSLTIEGLAEEAFGAFVNYFDLMLDDTLPYIEVYRTKGKLMNEAYGLTGDNAYPDDLNIVSIMLTNFKEGTLGRVALMRFICGGRWFNDIVDNNARREEEKKKNN